MEQHNLDELQKVIDEYGGAIVYSDYVVHSEVVEEHRWHVEEYTVVRIGENFYSVQWARAKTENGEDDLPISARSFTRVYPNHVIEVKETTYWETDPDRVHMTKFDRIAPFINKTKARNHIEEVLGEEEAKQAVKEARELMDKLKPLASGAGVAEFAYANEEYLKTLQKLLDLVY